MDGPQPGVLAARNCFTNCIFGDRLTPFKLQRIEIETHSLGVVDESLAKLTVAQDEPGPL